MAPSIITREKTQGCGPKSLFTRDFHRLRAFYKRRSDDFCFANDVVTLADLVIGAEKYKVNVPAKYPTIYKVYLFNVQCGSFGMNRLEQPWRMCFD
jgi:hypothetical protein